MPVVRAVLRRALQILANGQPNAHPQEWTMLTVQLLAHCLEWPPERVWTAPQQRVPADRVRRFYRMVRLWARGMPIQYLLGRWGFWNLRDLRTPPGVAIPRPATETLMTAVAARFPDATVPLRILDLGTGTGALAIALAVVYPRATVWAVDISTRAVQVARINAHRFHVADRVHIWQGDWLRAVRVGPFWDVVVCNPPYLTRRAWRAAPVSVRDFEPPEAFVSPGGPAHVYTTIGRQVRSRLRANGILFVEVGDRQAAHVRRWMERLGAVCVQTWRDVQGQIRCLAFRWPTDDRSAEPRDPEDGPSVFADRPVRQE